MAQQAAENDNPPMMQPHRVLRRRTAAYLVLLTNNLKLAATTVAEIYKNRWRSRLFFKALKQSCKVKTFVGTSANALKTQIWTALIAMLLVKILHMKSTFGWHLSNFMVLLRQQLFVYRDLWKWINDPFQAPEAAHTATGNGLRLSWTAELLDKGYSALLQDGTGSDLRQQTAQRITRDCPTRSAKARKRRPMSCQINVRPRRAAILDSSGIHEEDRAWGR